jgi:WD40 repeat protein
VNGVAFSPLGGTVASASKDATIRVWDVGTGECRLILIGDITEVMSVVYSPEDIKSALLEVETLTIDYGMSRLECVFMI